MSQFRPAPMLGGGGAESKLLLAYEYMGNPEARVESLDIDTDTFTSTAHGFSNGQTLFPTIYENAYNVSVALPAGLTFQYYFVINATPNTFQLSLSTGGASIAITGNANANLVVFQRAMIKSLAITGLPSITKCLVRSMIYASIDDKSQGVVLIPTGWAKTSDLGPNPGSAGAYSIGRGAVKGCFIIAEFDGSHRRKTVNGGYSAFYGDNAGASAAEFRNSQNINAVDWAFSGIDLTFYNTSLFIANRTIIEVYSL